MAAGNAPGWAKSVARRFKSAEILFLDYGRSPSVGATVMHMA